MRIMFLMGAASILAATMPVHATFTAYTNKAAWQAAAGTYNTITFTELPTNTLVVDQYASLGVHFTDGSDYIFPSDNLFVDFAGLNGAVDSTTLVFDTPQTCIALDFPGAAKIKLYSEGSLIYTSPTFGFAGVGNFGGLVATESFDQAVLYDPQGGFFADNLYFGPPVPGPGALALLGFAALFRTGRRRNLA